MRGVMRARKKDVVKGKRIALFVRFSVKIPRAAVFERLDEWRVGDYFYIRACDDSFYSEVLYD